MLEVFASIVIPSFVVIGAGLVLGRFVGSDITALNRVALYGAVPALVFTTLAETELAAGDAGRLVLGHALFLLAMYLLARLVTLLVPRPERASFVATSLFGNSANMMFPTTLYAFGEDGLVRALVLYVFAAFTLYTLGPLIIAGDEGIRRHRVAALARLPVVWAALLGLGVNLLGLRPPSGVVRGLDILAEAAIPLVLLLLGLQMYRSGVQPPTHVTYLGAALKLVAGPVLGFAAARLVGAEGLDLAVLTLLAAMPPAVNNLMLALEFGGRADQISKTIVLATLGSLVTLPVVVTFLLGRA